MKKSLQICWAALLLSLPLFTSCMRSETELHDTTNEILNKPQTTDEQNMQYLAEMEEYRGKVMSDIAANSKDILELKNELLRKGKAIPVETMEILDQLERQNYSMKLKIIDYTGDGIENWRSFKGEFSSDMKTLSNSLNTLRLSYSIH